MPVARPRSVRSSEASRVDSRYSCSRCGAQGEAHPARDQTQSVKMLGRGALRVASGAREAVRGALPASHGAVVRRGATAMTRASSTAKVWVDKNTRVLVQGFTGKQVGSGSSPS